MNTKKQKAPRQVLALMLACVIALSGISLPQPVHGADQPDAWAKAEVENAVYHGLVPAGLRSGYGNDITRAEFCRLAITFLDVATEKKEYSGEVDVVAEASFTDTKDPYVVKAAEYGIVTGVGGGKFEPNRSITRQEAAVMLNNTLSLLPVTYNDTVVSFTDDAQIASWAKTGVQRVASKAIMSGTGGGKFSPETTYTRQQAYVTFMRMLSSLFITIDISSLDLTVGDQLRFSFTMQNTDDTIVLSGGSGLVTLEMNGDTTIMTAVAAGTGTISFTLGEYMLPLSLKVTDPYGLAGGGNISLAGTVTDFTGKDRLRYSHDVAYDLCRQIENEIGIQIFYLPEWTDNPEGLVMHDVFDQLPELQQDYFEYVAQELLIMKEAFDLYPDGFLKEMVARKNGKGLEIILLPISLNGATQNGLHVVSSSTGLANTDQIYYCGREDVHFYGHEMGHQTMSNVMSLNGWNDSVSRWESYSGSILSHVTVYASSARHEDWAETWAYLWENPEYVETAMSIDTSGGLRQKMEFTTEVLTGHYTTMVRENLPWAHLL